MSAWPDGVEGMWTARCRLAGVMHRSRYLTVGMRAKIRPAAQSEPLTTDHLTCLKRSLFYFDRRDGSPRRARVPFNLAREAEAGRRAGYPTALLERTLFFHIGDDFLGRFHGIQRCGHAAIDGGLQHDFDEFLARDAIVGRRRACAGEPRWDDSARSACPDSGSCAFCDPGPGAPTPHPSSIPSPTSAEARSGRPRWPAICARAWWNRSAWLGTDTRLRISLSGPGTARWRWTSCTAQRSFFPCTSTRTFDAGRRILQCDPPCAVGGW